MLLRLSWFVDDASFYAGRFALGLPVLLLVIERLSPGTLGGDMAATVAASLAFVFMASLLGVWFAFVELVVMFLQDFDFSHWYARLRRRFA